MKNRKYTQKKISVRNRRRGIHLNNNLLKKNEIINKINNPPMGMLRVGGSGYNKGINILNNGWEIGIIAKRNKKLTQEQINTIKQDINNPKYFNLKLAKNFNIYIKLKPNKVITSKGILIRMGKGKGKIKTKAIYLLRNMVCIELKLKNQKNNLNLTHSYINRLFSKFIKKYTYLKIRTSLI